MCKDRANSVQMNVRVSYLAFIAVALMVSGCGRALVITVVDQESGSPVADVVVEHSQPKHLLGLATYYAATDIVARSVTDQRGQVLFKGVNAEDIITVYDGSEQGDDQAELREKPRAVFRRLWPIDKVDVAGMGSQAKYSVMNRNWDGTHLYLPVCNR